MCSATTENIHIETVHIYLYFITCNILHSMCTRYNIYIFKYLSMYSLQIRAYLKEIPNIYVYIMLK